MALTLFLSHKHIDSPIARELGDFIRSKSGGRVRVHLSSDPTFAGPRFGRNLNSELRKSLWDSDVLILVYTSADQDWSYCMWECGMATDPNSPDTAVVVFQCGSDVPAPLADTVRVNARRFDDLLSFSRRFFVEEVHPGQNEALCPGWKDRDCEAVARELFEALQKVLPTVDQPESFSPWPYIAVDLPFSEVSAIERDRSIARAKITQSSTVSGDARAAEIFGLSSFGAARSLGDVLAQWRGQFPDRTAAWFDFCCEQIIQGSVRELPVVRCSTVKDAAGPAEFTALLNQVKRSPRENKVTFEFAFFDLADPRGTVVTERMIPAGAMLKFTIGNQGPSAVDLRALRKFMKDNARNRLPLLNPSNAALYVIHRSTIDEFLLDTDIAQPTLADLLQQPGKQDALESSVAFVPQDANLAEAAAELTSACSDVFVTLNGRSDEPILGWLTNADLSRDAVRRRAAGSDA